MSATTKYELLRLTILSFLLTISEQSSNCSPINPTNITNCKKLITLEAEFGWHIRNPTQIDILLSIGLPADQGAKWLAWGVNPGPRRPMMIGTRAIIGILQPNGKLAVRQYNITSDTKLGCRLQPSEKFEDVSFQNIKGDVRSNKYMSISATLTLPPDQRAYNISKLNHVWQIGFVADEALLEPKMHATALRNFDSTETLNLLTGRGVSIGHHRHHLRTVHGILNIIGWGMLLPLGVIIARYYRSYPFQCETWYALHISCQIVGYTLGTAGWAIGVWLGHASRHYNFLTHRLLAIFIFAFTTLQMLALRLMPGQNDDYRKYWDMYHHFLGYALLAVISVNIFHGIAILKPNKTWLWVYIGGIALLAFIAVGLEIWTWSKFLIKSHKTRRANTGQVADNVTGQANVKCGLSLMFTATSSRASPSRAQQGPGSPSRASPSRACLSGAQQGPGS